jgi:hypothetical protein
MTTATVVGVPAPVELPDPHALVRTFAANPAFRAAEWSELSTPDVPFRRPVRPDDLSWLDYGVPMPEADCLKLSALLGHRMLRNVHDLDQLMVPPGDSAAAAAEHPHFYNESNRLNAVLAAPVLERHLFTFLETRRPESAGITAAGLKQRVLAEYDRRIAEPGRAFKAALSTKGRRESATFTAIQYSAFAPAAWAAVGRNAVGEYGAVPGALRTALLKPYLDRAALSAHYADLLDLAGMTTTPGGYWQLNLGSSLARGNHLHTLAAKRENAFAFLGAYLHLLLDEAATAARFAEVFEDGLGTRPAYFDTLPVLSRAALGDLTDTIFGALASYGDTAAEQAAAGFADAVSLAEIWDGDLADQLEWADDIPACKELAERLHAHIEAEKIEIDLDTFVESHEETSTTHVHDDHRLVVIEAGQMHFWNNITHRIDLATGDKVFIPLSRLHGSTVLSGECTYHQPIIPEEMYQRFK